MIEFAFALIVGLVGGLVLGALIIYLMEKLRTL